MASTDRTASPPDAGLRGSRPVRPRADPKGLRQAARVALLLGLLLVVVGWWRKDRLPPPERMQPEVLQEPAQVAVSLPAFRTVVEGVEYSIQPRYTYDLSGLVVSLHHSDTWWDSVHQEWDDHINLMDLCVVWGANASSGIYQQLRFTNSQFTCTMSSAPGANWQTFNPAQASNNHLVTDKPEIARALRLIHVGDQVRVRGYLVDYTVFRNGAPFAHRVTSTSRTDEDCEVIYIDSIERLAHAGPLGRVAYVVGIALLVLGALTWLLLPVRRIDDDDRF